MDILLILSLAIVIALNVVVGLRRPPEPFWPVLPLGFLAILLWTISETVLTFQELSLHADRLWTYALYTGILWVAPTWFLLAQRFAASSGQRLPGSERIRFGVPMAVSFALWLMMITQQWHGSYMEPVPGFGTRNDYRAGWYLSVVWNYLLLAVTAGIYLNLARRVGTQRGRRQALTMAVATALPPLCNFPYVAGYLDPGYDLTVLGIGVSSMLIFVGIYREHLFALSAGTWRELLLSETDGIVLLDGRGQLVHANTLAVDLFGEGVLAVGADGFDVLSERLRLDEEPDRPLNAGELRYRLADPELHGTGGLFRLDHPTREWVRLFWIPIRGAGGRLQGAGIRARDVTALRSASDDRARQAAVLETILESSERGLLVVDLHENIVYANEAFERIWGYRRGTFSGKAQERLQHAAHVLQNPEGFVERIQSYYDDPYSRGSDELVLKDGRILVRTTTPLLDRGRPLGRIWDFEDVTVRRRAETERDSTERRLLETQRLESLGVLAGGIAHDFNNLLLGIVGYTELALQDARGTMREYLEFVQDAANQAGELTQQILAYSGRGQMLADEVDLSELVRQTVRLMAGTLPPDVCVSLALRSGVRVQGDRTQLQQLILNLVRNAAEALPEGTGTVTLRTHIAAYDSARPIVADSEVTVGAGSYAVLEVEDSGPGVPTELVPSIFDPFYSTKSSGRGLGLAAVLGIVRGHGGAIDVEVGAEVCGSVFRVDLPLRSAAVSGGDGRLVLVVDDEVRIREAARATLRQSGYACVTAVDAAEGVECARAYAAVLALVILDLGDTNADPRETVQKMHLTAPGVPIVLSGTLRDETLRHRALEWGAQGVLSKPYSPAALVRCVRAHEAENTRTSPERGTSAAP